MMARGARATKRIFHVMSLVVRENEVVTHLLTVIGEKSTGPVSIGFPRGRGLFGVFGSG